MRLAHLLEHCSPHARGWTRARGRQERAAALLPARAGMDPWPSQPQGVSRPAPRTRGDGPERVDLLEGGVHCSPHARGWTPRRVRLDQRLALLPARAGMDPSPCTRSGWTRPAPRTRGGGPGMRARRRGPGGCSPHARGWTLAGSYGLVPVELLPARAGMDPVDLPTPPFPVPAPRTRGDGPVPFGHYKRFDNCSPHARGWTPGRGHDRTRPPLLPARAGMDPTPPSTSSCTGAAPRTRGAPPVPKTPTVLCTVAPSLGLPARPVPSPTPRSPSPREDEHRVQGAHFGVDRDRAGRDAAASIRRGSR